MLYSEIIKSSFIEKHGLSGGNTFYYGPSVTGGKNRVGALAPTELNVRPPLISTPLAAYDAGYVKNPKRWGVARHLIAFQLLIHVYQNRCQSFATLFIASVPTVPIYSWWHIVF